MEYLDFGFKISSSFTLYTLIHSNMRCYIEYTVNTESFCFKKYGGAREKSGESPKKKEEDLEDLEKGEKIGEGEEKSCRRKI